MTTLPLEARQPPEHPGDREKLLRRFRHMVHALVAGTLLGALSPVHADEPHASAPAVSNAKKTGTLVIAGGSNRLPDGSYRTEIEDRFLELVERVEGEQTDIVVIPTLSITAEDDDAASFFRPKRRASLKKLHTRNRDEANTYAFTEPIRKAKGVWVAGGKQLRWADAYAGTLLEKELLNVMGRGGVIGTTSASTALISQEAIIGGDPAEIGVGIDMVRGGVFDMHLERGRLPRLLKVVRPGRVGIGIDSDTALIVEGTRAAVVMGIGNVRICTLSSDGEQKVQVLSAGDTVDLSTLKINIAPHAKSSLSVDVKAGMP